MSEIDDISDEESQFDDAMDRPQGTPEEEQAADQLPDSDMPDDSRIDQIEETVEQLNDTVDTLCREVMLPRTPPEALLATVNANNTWRERVVINGSVVDFVDGLICNGTSDACKAISLASSDRVLLRVRDGASLRYVIVSGGGNGNAIAFQITGTYATDGRYYGRQVISNATDGSYTPVGTDSAFATMIIVNTKEIGLSGWAIDGGDDDNIFIGVLTNGTEDGFPLVIADMVQFFDCGTSNSFTGSVG